MTFPASGRGTERHGKTSAGIDGRTPEKSFSVSLCLRGDPLLYTDAGQAQRSASIGLYACPFSARLFPHHQM